MNECVCVCARLLCSLQVVLCFSPVGDTLRVRCRNFPAVVNCTSIDWFHEWPEEALVSVSHRFLEDVELLTVRGFGAARWYVLYSPIVSHVTSVLSLVVVCTDDALYVCICL